MTGPGSASAPPDGTGRTLAFAAVLEAATGLVLIALPARVADLLLGAPLSGAGTALARCFGIALLALGLAAGRDVRAPKAAPRPCGRCWPITS